MSQSYSNPTLKSFILRRKPKEPGELTAVSLFSGAGLSDLGYALAGFEFIVQAEIDPDRARVGQHNFPRSAWIVGDVRKTAAAIAEAYRSKERRPLDLLVSTPPCQGMSPSNPGRGSRVKNTHRANEERNGLVLSIVPIVHQLRPRAVVVENVRPLLTLTVLRGGGEVRLLDELRRVLTEYKFLEGVVDMADYGVPQNRKRAIVVGVRQDQNWRTRIVDCGRAPWPCPTHGPIEARETRKWVSVGDWLRLVGYEPLDARDAASTTGTHPLHFVPHYEKNPDRYLQISQIPQDSGLSAFANSTCPSCGATDVPRTVVLCNRCGELMRNRPYVVRDGTPRLITGFGDSSYRRMLPDRPAPTVTTNSSHVGSDRKIHPREHRVMSILEVADLQTIPRFYDWSPATQRGLFYVIRSAVGEAFPPFFTFQHGKLLGALIRGKRVPLGWLAPHVLRPRSPHSPGLLPPGGHRGSKERVVGFQRLNARVVSRRPHLHDIEKLSVK